MSWNSHNDLGLMQTNRSDKSHRVAKGLVLQLYRGYWQSFSDKITISFSVRKTYEDGRDYGCQNHSSWTVNSLYWLQLVHWPGKLEKQGIYKGSYRSGKTWKTWKLVWIYEKPGNSWKIIFFKGTHGKVMEFFCHTSKTGISIIIGSPWTLQIWLDGS